jgi:CRP-like cAMP-binding protein
MRAQSPPRTARESLWRHLVSFRAGARIYAEGEVGTEMFTIRSGEVEITRTIAGQNRVLARLRKGDFFGEMSVLEDVPREATARARTNVELVRVNGAEFEAMLKRSPEIALQILRGLSRRLREAADTFEGALERRKAVRAYSSPVPVRWSSEAPLDADLCQLVASDGATRFALNRDGDTVVGRADPATQTVPDADLTPLDSKYSVSRRHARLYRIGSTVYVMEELGAAHGTFVNDKRLETGVPAPIHSGDVLKIGLVTLTFWNPST